MLPCISLLLVWLLCVTSQSVDNSGSCNAPPTCNCTCRVGGTKSQTVDLSSLDDTKKEFQRLNSKFKDLSSYCLPKVLANNCDEFAKLGFRTNGVYNITIGNQTTEVYCDMETDGGGWTVIQRRTSNETDFYRDWRSYEIGFGNISDNFWLGLENIHAITSSGSYKLRVNLEDLSGNTAYELYSSFSIGNESSNYKLHVSGSNGTAGDSLKDHNNKPFTTKDRDNDVWWGNCAVQYHGAWWYKDCYKSNLNGKYYNSEVIYGQGIQWYYWKRSFTGWVSMKRAEMEIKPN